MTWKLLSLSSSRDDDLPRMLHSTKIDSSGYTIHLTDLTTIWSESLTRREIINRSFDERTSIDPSSEGQLNIFLRKINQAMSGKPGTSLELRVDEKTQVSGIKNLILQIHVDLPKGLTALKWHMRLSVGPPALLTKLLIVPILRLNHHTLKNVNTLSQVIKRKDRIIEKLLDKIEEQGIEFGQLFPQIALKERGKFDRESVLKKVRYLSPFDFEALKICQSLEYFTQDVSSLIDDLFKDENFKIVAPLGVKVLSSKKENRQSNCGKNASDLKISSFPFDNKLQGCYTLQTESQSRSDDISDVSDQSTTEMQAFEPKISSFESKKKMKHSESKKSKKYLHLQKSVSTSSATVFFPETDGNLRAISKFKSKLVEADNEAELDDKASSLLPESKKQLANLVKKNKFLEIGSAPSSNDHYLVEEEEPQTRELQDLEPKKQKGKLIFIKGRKKKASSIDQDIPKEKSPYSKTQDQKSLLISPISPSFKGPNLQIIKGTKRTFASAQVTSSNLTENYPGCNYNGLKSIQHNENHEKNVMNVEKSLEKANKKRADLKREIDLRMACNAPIKKKRLF